MVPALRTAFNTRWREERYDAFLDGIRKRVGVPIEFPLSETPCFLPRDLVESLSRAGEELILQSVSGRAAEAAAGVVPERFRGAGAGATPTFLQVDFGLVRGPDGALEPRLVELQAFPSLYGFQVALSDAYRKAFNLEELDTYLGGLTATSYTGLLRHAIVGEHDPSEVVLMEIEPTRQKTRPDFVMTEQLWGVRAVDTGDVSREGRQLFYQRDGRLHANPADLQPRHPR